MKHSQLPMPDENVCMVCGIEIVHGRNYHRSLLPLCDACKKFFYRNCDKLDTLACLTCQNDCTLIANNNNNNNNRCPLCPRCRLVKCLSIGMTSTKRQKSSPKNKNQDREASSNQAAEPAELRVNLSEFAPKDALVKFPVMNENRFAETVLQVAVKACEKLTPLHNMPWTTSRENIINEVQMWSFAVKNFQFASNIVLFYADKLCEIIASPSSLTQLDRGRLFAGSYVPNLIAQVASRPSSSEFRYFGMNSNMKSTNLRLFPFLKALEGDVDEIASLFTAWNPSLAEFAILQALLFFRSDDFSQRTRAEGLNNFDQPEIIIEANRHFLVALTALNAQSQFPHLNMHFFHRAHDLLQALKCHFDDLLAEVSQRRHDLVHSDKISNDMVTMFVNDRKQRISSNH